MAMAAGGPIKELCEEATCSICLEFFKDPVTLDCGHNFCQVCLSQHRRGFSMALSCPQCRETDQRRSFRPNRQLANVVELVKKLQEEKRAEGKWGVCKRHHEPLKLFCEDDQVPCCMLCDRSKEHQGHNMLPLEETSQAHKKAPECASWRQARSCSMATQYLKMDMSKLIEHCQKKGLESRGLSMEELRVLLIQQAGQPEQGMAKLQAEERELAGQRRREPREGMQLQAQKKQQEEQLAEQRKHELGLLQLRKKETGRNIAPTKQEHKRAPNVTSFKERTCYNCGEVGHLKANCPNLGKPVYRVTVCYVVGSDPEKWGYTESVLLRDRKVRGLLSTGSDISMVHADLVSPSDIVAGESFIIESITGDRNLVPVARLPVEWRGVKILKDTAVAKDLFVPMIIGRDLLFHDPGFTLSASPYVEWKSKDTKKRPKGKAIPKQASMGMGNWPAAVTVESVDPGKSGNRAVKEKIGNTDYLVQEDLLGISCAEEEELPEGCSVTDEEVIRLNSLLYLPEGFGMIGMDPNDDDYMSQGLLYALQQSEADALKECMAYENDDLYDGDDYI